MNKKLLALLLAILMVAVSACAMAETDPESGSTTPPSYSDSLYKDGVAVGGFDANTGNLTIPKAYVLEGDGTSPAETFTFTVTPADNAPTNLVTKSTEPVFAKGAASVPVTNDGATTYTTANLVLKIGEITDVAPGKYEYNIEETASNNQGVTTITDAMKLVVTVVTNPDGTKARVIALHQGNNKVTQLTGNTYTANKITIDKDVAGLMGNRKEDFKVTVTLNAETKKVINIDNLVLPNGAVANPNSGSVAEVTISGITVSHDVNAEIGNVPAGTTYTVAENLTDDQKNVYDTPVIVYGDDANAVNATMGSAAKTVKITNTAKTTTIDTGVNTDNTPYILLMALVAIMALAFVAKKRSVRE